MFNDIINNLSLLILPIVAFGFAWFTNFSASIYYNVGIIKELFDKKRLIDGVIKMVSVGLALVSLAVCITIVIAYCKEINIPVDSKTLDGLNIFAIIAIFTQSTLAYAKQGYDTISDIIGFKKK